MLVIEAGFEPAREGLERVVTRQLEAARQLADIGDIVTARAFYDDASSSVDGLDGFRDLVARIAAQRAAALGGGAGG